MSHICIVKLIETIINNKMNKQIIKSIGAILAGFVLGAILSITSDSILEKLGIMSVEKFEDSSFGIIILVITYRLIFNVTGCYLTAKLAPSNPMKHVIIIGIIGTILSILGAIALWDRAIPFYNITIILISFPSAWLGGKLFLKNNNNGKTKN
jgi:uncharacterized protein YacL